MGRNRTPYNSDVNMRWGIIILLFLLFALMTYSYVEHNKKDPDMEYILKHFEKYKNTEVSFVGKVINVSDGEIEITLMESPFATLVAEIKNTSVEKGDVVEIVGILDGKEHVTAEKIIATSEWKYNLVFIRSLPAIPFILYFFLRNWKFNFKKFMFEGKNA